MGGCRGRRKANYSFSRRLYRTNLGRGITRPNIIRRIIQPLRRDSRTKKKSPFLTQRFTDSLPVGNCKEFSKGGKKKRQRQCFLASTHLSLSALSEQITHLLSAAQTRSQNEQIRFLWEWAGPGRRTRISTHPRGTDSVTYRTQKT